MHHIQRSCFREINRYLPSLSNVSIPMIFNQYRLKSSSGLIPPDYITEDEMQNFLDEPVATVRPHNTNNNNNSNNNNNNSNISQNGLKSFLQKLAVKPKEAKMWLKYFQTSPVDSGLPFAVLLVNEDVFFQQKLMESMAWSLAFLVQNNMNPIVVFEITAQARRYHKLLNGDETYIERMIVFGKYLKEKLSEFGAEGDLLLEDRNPFKMWKPLTTKAETSPTLTVNTSSIFQSIQNKKIPVLSNLTYTDDSAPLNPLDIIDLLVSKFRPMKTMILGTDRGVVDANNKVISDLAIPSDLSLIDSADWLPPSQKYILKRCANMIQMLPSSSSVILTSADTIIQELFTHHGTGTMIKCLEKISKYRSPHKLDKARFNRLLEISFRKAVSHDYWEKIDANIDTIFVSEKFSAAGVVLKLPNIDIPYLDKIAVHPEAQGSGLAASLWNEICKDYPKLFWRSKRVNESAGAWYNTVSQGSWKTDDWTVYWYGLTNCEEVLPLVTTALLRPESFTTVKSPTLMFQ